MASRQTDLNAAVWRTSSYSNGSGGDCVEIGEDFLGAARWRTSTYTNGDGGNCVEVADDLPGIVPVRDTKDRDGGTVIVPAAAWGRFITAVKGGALSA
ncbi:DUF397 domain-containing protein [Streptomyces sp. NPDC048644]|uniref:DUF397 domain-containing protein n=1 Tax=Streptomyces sp. NPDC048644 TaxID=3365582 RepID=UPI00371D4925